MPNPLTENHLAKGDVSEAPASQPKTKKHPAAMACKTFASRNAAT